MVFLVVFLDITVGILYIICAVIAHRTSILLLLRRLSMTPESTKFSILVKRCFPFKDYKVFLLAVALKNWRHIFVVVNQNVISLG